MMTQKKQDETLVSSDEESLATPAANPSTDIVERPNAILKGSESGRDMPREAIGRIRIYRMDDDVVDLGQVRVNEMSEGVSRQSMSVVAGKTIRL